MTPGKKILLLSIGYGRGHHSAAAALAEEMQRRGWLTELLDACCAASPALFRLTQVFYRTCVRRFPQLWGVAYSQIDNARWNRLLCLPGIARSMRFLRKKLRTAAPDLIVCTYPLYAYMLDVFVREGWLHTPYAVVVTDALSVNSAWVRSDAPLLCLPDTFSCDFVQQHFRIPRDRLAPSGFPVRSAFRPGPPLPVPGAHGEGLHIMYGVHAPLARVCDDLCGMFTHWPGMQLTLLAEDRANRLRRLLAKNCPRALSSVTFYSGEEDPSVPLRTSHLYIGKAGASTVFEAYASETPMLINYLLPGQEEGNLQLLIKDGVGRRVEDTQDLLATLHTLLDNGAAGLSAMRLAMHTVARGGGAAGTADALEARFFPQSIAE